MRGLFCGELSVEGLADSAGSKDVSLEDASLVASAHDDEHMNMFALGIDFGTSGARAIAIDPHSKVVAQSQRMFTAREVTQPSAWRQTLWQLLADVEVEVRGQLSRIAINGTSATVLLCDRNFQPLTAALLYNDKRARNALEAIQSVAPASSPTLSATSSLVKALWWSQTLPSNSLDQAALLCHQADWLAAQLHGQQPVSDYHNALKLGYDVRSQRYPDWLLNLLMTRRINQWLPEVKEPGESIAVIAPDISKRFSIPATCQICAGTTDSIAAFIASGATQLGEAVTSLGSTLVLKVLSDVKIDHPAFGLYSHRLGDLWLVGGASNTGGAVLKQHFSDEEITALSAQIDLSRPCNLHYYPLNSPGERFPINDPDYPPRLIPKPDSEVDFLYGLLDAIARIETEGYQKLQSLGSPAVKRIYTAGGGAKNAKWQLLRQQHLHKDVTIAKNAEAAYGTAELALEGLSAYKISADKVRGTTSKRV